jgi:hypothetical protein
VDVVLDLPTRTTGAVDADVHALPLACARCLLCSPGELGSGGVWL